MDRLAIIGILAAALVAAGCSWSSGVFQVGPDRYQIYNTAVGGFGDAAAARTAALQTATDYCAGLNRQARILVAASYSQFSNVEFRCVDQGRR